MLTTERILSEDVITLADAQKELKPLLGRRPDKTTLYRWCLNGVGGVRLEHVRIGNRILVSRQALTRFIEAPLTASKTVHQTTRWSIW